LPCMLCMVEYIVKTLPIYAMKFKFIHTCIDCVGVCSIYDGYTNITYFCSI
jgi:hypothetical protein